MISDMSRSTLRPLSAGVEVERVSDAGVAAVLALVMLKLRKANFERVVTSINAPDYFNVVY